MRVEKFKINKQQKLSEFISEKFSLLSYNFIMKMIRNKDVKINDKRVSSDIILNVNDVVLLYLPNGVGKVDIVYEDENLIIVNKPRKIETVSESGENDLCLMVENQINLECHPVHRLDRNTEGLVIFAKNLQAKNSLDHAIKDRKIDKFYLALVYGNLPLQTDKMIAYLKKDNSKAYVDVVDEYQNGYSKIQTNYKVLKSFDDCSLVEVELVTGKTHQIRAHFAHIGHFVIGDEKYGDSMINKKFKSKFQNLCAYKLIFHFEKGDYLFYLNEKNIELDKSKIKFCQNL